MMAEILLLHGKVALIDDEDFDWLDQWKWRAYKGRHTYYAERHALAHQGERGPHIKMHRVLLGVTESRMQVDHRNGDGLDNRRSNLRIATHAQNQWNCGKTRLNTSGFKGVSFDKVNEKWVARLAVGGRYLNLGRFPTPEEASEAYQEAALRHRGEFATDLGKDPA